MKDRNFWIAGGLIGVLSGFCCLAAILIPWSDTQAGRSASLLVVSGWPILAIIYSYAVYSFIAAERPGASNTLAFVFATVAFTTVLGMIIVQLAVVSGVGETAQGLDPVTLKALRRSLRWVDLGLDVAWDMLIGTSLVLSGLAMRRRSGLGMGWTIPSIGFGVALIGLNAATFPWPPANHGLFDIGPFILLFFMALSLRIAILGLRERPLSLTA